MLSLRAQKGLSPLGWLFVLAVFGFVLLVSSKIGGFYLDNRFVTAALSSLAEDPNFPQMTTSEIRTKIRKTFTVNNIRGKPAESVKIKKNSRRTLVTINYEERVHLFLNIDVIVAFNHELNSLEPEKCCAAPKNVEE